MSKKIILLILVLGLILLFASCGENKEEALTPVDDAQKEAASDAPKELISPSAIVDEPETVYLLSYDKVQYNSGDSILIRDGNNEKLFLVMADGHSFRDFMIVIDDEDILSVRNNKAGTIWLKLESEGRTKMSLVTGSKTYSFDVISFENSEPNSKEVIESKIENQKEETVLAQDTRDYNAEKRENIKNALGREPKYDMVVKTFSDKQLDDVLDKCSFPAALGSRLLDAKELRELSVKTPSEIAEAIKTVADVFAYLKTVSFTIHHDVYTAWYNGWGMGLTGEIEICDNDYNACGGMANVVGYLLYEDYDEVGSLQWIGGDNHVINYVKKDGKYYLLDFTQLCWNGEWPGSNLNWPILDKLEDFKDVYDTNKVFFSSPPSQEEKKPINAVLARTIDAGVACPVKWNNEKGVFTVPTERNGNAHIIYYDDNYNETAENCLIYEKVETEIPGWNADYTNLIYR